MDRDAFSKKIATGILVMALGLAGIAIAYLLWATTEDKVMCGVDEMRAGDKCVTASGGSSTIRGYEQQSKEGAPIWLLPGVVSGVVVLSGAVWTFEAVRRRKLPPARRPVYGRPYGQPIPPSGPQDAPGPPPDRYPA
ncbi:hypothetical protein ACWDOP_13390 [Nocardia sp. NPDC003693]